MPKSIKKLLESSSYFIAIFLTLFIIYLSLSSLEELNIEITASDKLLHTTAYVALAYSWLFAIKSSHNSFKNKIIIGIVIIIFGIIIEVLQTNMSQNRHGDVIDVVANSIGVTIAIVTFNILFRFLKVI